MCYYFDNLSDQSIVETNIIIVLDYMFSSNLLFEFFRMTKNDRC